MGTRFFILLIAVLVFTMACTDGSKTAGTRVDYPDTLLVSVQKKLRQKHQLMAIREKLFNSRTGQALKKYKPIIKKYAKRYGFNWRLIAAQIVQESGFREKAKSRVGARGLMQLMPLTAREISSELDIQYIMRSPRENITAGIYHLRKQVKLFPDANPDERLRLGLASYNAGAGRVFDAQRIARFYKRPINRWPTVRPYLAMLKKSDWQVHLQVWPNGKPRYGYFYGSNETINYVDHIWENFLLFRKIL